MVFGGAMACACNEGLTAKVALWRMLHLVQAQKGFFVRAAVYALPRWLVVSVLSWFCTFATLLLPFFIAAHFIPWWVSFLGPVDSFVLRAIRAILLIVLGLLLLWGHLFKKARDLRLRIISVAGLIVTLWCLLILPFLPREWAMGSESWLAEAWAYLWQGQTEVSRSTTAALGISGFFMLINSLVIVGIWLFLYPLAAGVCLFFSIRRAAEGTKYRVATDMQKGTPTSLFSAPGTFLFTRGGSSALESLKPPRGWIALTWIGFNPRILAFSSLAFLVAGLVGIVGVSVADMGTRFLSADSSKMFGYGIALLAALTLTLAPACREISLKLRRLEMKAQPRVLKTALLPYYALGAWVLCLVNLLLFVGALALGASVALVPGGGPVLFALLYPLMLPGANLIVASTVRWVPSVFLLPAVVATDIGPSGRVSDVLRQTEHYAATSSWATLGALLTSLPFSLAPAAALLTLSAWLLPWNNSPNPEVGSHEAIGILVLIVGLFLTVVGLAVAMTNGYLIVRQSKGDQPLRVGDLVILGRHQVVNGGDNWNPDMDAYVGRQARVTAFVGPDPYGCDSVRVDLDRGVFVWRLANISRTVL
jgi:hypothetical protein